MSLHAIFSFHEMTKSVLPSVARERKTDSARPVISPTWRATAEALRASLGDKPERDIELDCT